ncbi:hypothetical protein [Paracoccus pacificus]|uniref:Antifreeze glycopeptide polyprotein n=1 Tax=Paracoccus pacificus TaxID=1463598 RepID=A0ABW4R4A9_9RHOB
MAARLPAIAAAAALSMGCGATAFAQQGPLSSNDWLTGKGAPPPPVSTWRPGDPLPGDAVGRRPKSPPVAQSGAVESVGVSRLDGENPDSKGVVAAREAGLPVDLWGESEPETLATLIQSAGRPVLPAMQTLLRRALLTQLDPPRGNGAPGALFLARVDSLLSQGALQDAAQLLDAAGPADAQRFRRQFDVAVLSGDESHACDIIRKTPGVAPDQAARIFCLALSGDWNAAALTFRGAVALGEITPPMDALMARYLDDSYADATDQIGPPQETPSPLVYRLHEAIGEPLATASLPLVFSAADLRSNSGWKAQIEAAERLARAGSLDPAQLRSIYSEQQPPASGGVWDRAAAIQKLTGALQSSDSAAVDAALPPAWDQMAAAGLSGALAAMAAPELSGFPNLSGRAAQIALWIAAMEGQQPANATPAPADDRDAFIAALARGDTSSTPAPAADPQGVAAMLKTVFDAPAPAVDALSGPFAELIAANRRGEALLRAIPAVDAATEGDLNRASAGLLALRALGQEDPARRAAVQIMLLGPRSGTDPG